VSRLIPLTELTGTYRGESGGLYGDERNDPPPAHLAAAMHAAAQIRPLDADGDPAEDGRIVLLSLGLSNTTMEYALFRTMADADPQKSPRVVVVDGAQGGRPSFTWAASGASSLPLDEVQRLDRAFEVVGLSGLRNHPSEWVEVERRLTAAGVTPKQVQAAWLKQTFPLPGHFGEFPSHARSLQADLADIVVIAKSLYPNLRLLYLSSRTFGGYALDAKNPEPYAYESAFAVPWLIQEQINGDPRLNHDAERGAVTAPVLLWGPYLWTNGTKPRQGDGLVWEKTDVSERDGMHPSPSGCRKVPEILLRFLKTDETARTWFTGA